MGFAAPPDNQALQSGVKSQAVPDSKKAKKDQMPPLSDAGTTYAMAQVSAFISDDYYAVGRWGNHLLVANCSVGENDFNLWSYSINRNTWNITLSDRKNLKVNSSAPQVYNFDVIFAPDETDDLTFFSSTGEGALWYGTVDSHGKIHAEGYKQVNENSIGAALCMSGNKLAVTTYDLREFIYSRR